MPLLPPSSHLRERRARGGEDVSVHAVGWDDIRAQEVVRLWQLSNGWLVAAMPSGDGT